MDGEYIGPIKASSGCVTSLTIILCVFMICVASVTCRGH